MSERRRGTQTLAKAAARLTRPAFGKRGLADGAIVRDWGAIVGETMARHTAPEKIIYPGQARGDGTLHLRVDSGSFATVLQHDEPQLVERINTYFGYRAVARLKLVHGPLPPRPEGYAAPEPELNEAQQEDLEARMDSVDNPDLRKPLERLGRSLMARGGEKDDP